MKHIKLFEHGHSNLDYQPGDHLTPEFQQREQDYTNRSSAEQKMIDDVKKKDNRVQEIMKELINKFEEEGSYQAKLLYDTYKDEVEKMTPYNSVFLHSPEMRKLLQSDTAAETTQIKDPKKIFSDLLAEFDKKAKEQNVVPKRNFIQKFKDFLENPQDPTRKYRGGY